jgi:hypothetical protein
LPQSISSDANFLSRDWPLLLESCSLPRDPARITARAGALCDAVHLVDLADSHGVVGQLSAALAGVSGLVIPSSISDSLRLRQRAHVISNLAMAAELLRLLEQLRKFDIECVVVKGPVLSLRAFDDSAARQYGDLDLLLRQADIPRAAEILVAAGCKSRIPAHAIRAGRIPGEYRFHREDSKIIVELHTECTLRYFPKPIPIDAYFRRKTSLILDGLSVSALSAEDEFVLISIHGAIHFWERLMWIADIAAMIYNHPELDWERIRQSAAEVGAQRMICVALLLAERLLRVPVPAAMTREVANDAGCSRLVDDIETWLPYAGAASPPFVKRALFRFRMPGKFLAGLAYLTRLSFSTTEDDWTEDVDAPRSRIAEMLGRPFRLAKKYRDPNP